MMRDRYIMGCTLPTMFWIFMSAIAAWYGDHSAAISLASVTIASFTLFYVGGQIDDGRRRRLHRERLDILRRRYPHALIFRAPFSYVPSSEQYFLADDECWSEMRDVAEDDEDSWRMRKGDG